MNSYLTCVVLVMTYVVMFVDGAEEMHLQMK